MIGEGYCWCPYVPTNLDKNNYFIDERGGVLGS
jgi:Zn-finger protein